MTSDSMGKVPALCAPSGPFLTNYTACVACGEEQSHNGNADGGGGGWGGRGIGDHRRPPTTRRRRTIPRHRRTSTPSSASTSATATGATQQKARSRRPAFTTDIILAHEFTEAASPTGPAATVTATPGAADTTNSGGSGDRVWIAGPIVGAILGTALVILSVVFVMYYRRRRKRRAMGDAGGPSNSSPDTRPEVSHTGKPAVVAVET
ncbi:hypothetical protein PG994_007471 [Apiospora phragmitis]|uniref:Uncharacterized protein n=1 Tax=Apiospora phragmitis TaxID=2905665 RepID=A0ABR1V488_9PEZI